MARQRVPTGPAPTPGVQKLRIRYAKRGRLRFSSTRDFARALERALRRAGVPMAYSAGFHPHPKISYANATRTGTASEAEYFEITVTQRVDPEAVRSALDEALPPGLDVVEVVEAGPGSLADRLEASVWRVEMPEVAASTLSQAVADYLSREVVEVSRMFKSGARTFDTRAAVLEARVEDRQDDACAILRMVVRHTTPAVRPDDILTAMQSVSGFTPPRPPTVTRLAQGPRLATSAGVADPLAADKEVAGS